MAEWRRTLILIFILALLIRGIFILTMQNGFYFADSVRYSAAAVSLLATGDFGEKYTRPPVYPVFLAGIYAVFGERMLAVRAVCSFISIFVKSPTSLPFTT